MFNNDIANAKTRYTDEKKVCYISCNHFVYVRMAWKLLTTKNTTNSYKKTFFNVHYDDFQTHALNKSPCFLQNMQVLNADNNISEIDQKLAY